MRSFITALVVIGSTAAFAPGVEVARAEQQASYEVLVPAAVAVNPATDRVVITARASSSTELTSACTAQAGPYPTHSAVIDGEDEAPVAGVVVLSAQGLRAGTVLGDLVAAGSCTDNGVEYVKFVAVVK